MRVLHTGDWHIGNFPGPEKNGENVRYLDIVHCLDELDKAARQLRPDLIIVAGDIFHQTRVWSDRGLKENQTVVRILRQLETTAPVIVMRGTPNHDSEEQFRSLKNTFYKDDSVHIITEPGIQTYHTYNGQRVQVACIPGFNRGYYRAKHPGLSKEEENEVFTEAVADMIIGLKAQAEPDIPAILVSHFTITGCNMESGQTAFFSQFEPVVYPDTLTAAGYDLVCFGHIHRPQQLDGCKNAFYCGAVSALNFNDEGQRRGFYIHEIEDGTCESKFVELPTREYITIRLKDEDVEQIITGFEQFHAPETQPDVKDKIVRVLYDCTDEHNKAFNHAIYEKLLYAAGAFWVQEITPQKISITVDRRSMDADNIPEANLYNYFVEKGSDPKHIDELLELAKPIIAEATAKATTERHTGVFLPVEIEVKNYRNYREEKFSFDGIRFCTINGSNGVGKSSLFMDAMIDALFEETREGELTGWICNDPDARSGTIKFTFRLGEKLYRVTRTRQKSGKATLNIAEQVDGEWVDRSKEKLKDTQAEIISIIGMDSLTLKACALIMQDQYGLFLQADKEARMNILGNILGLGIYGDMEDLASTKATDANREIRNLTGQANIIAEGLPNADRLKTDIEMLERDKEELESFISGKTSEIDGLKVSLNTQLEATERVSKLSEKIDALTSQKASKEAQITAQSNVVLDASVIIIQKAVIEEGVAKYESLLEREKELIASKAAYDSLTVRNGQVESAIKEAQNTASDLGLIKDNLISTQISPLREFVERASELIAKHKEYEAAQAELTELEARMPEHTRQREALQQAEANALYIKIEHEKEIDKLASELNSLQSKVALLQDSGCPIPENAQCKFLADALKAQAAIPGADAAIENENARYEAAYQKASDSVSKAQTALNNNLHLQEEIEAQRSKIRVLATAEQDYQQLEANKQTLATLEDRIAEMDARIADANKSVDNFGLELAEIERQLAEAAEGAKEYESLQKEIADAKKWTDKEKQLLTAHERKTAAESRITELETDLRTIENDLSAAKQELSVEQAKTVGADELKQQVEAAEALIKQTQKKSQDTAVKLGGLRKQLEDTEAKLNQASEIQLQINDLGVKAVAYEELKKAFSQDGIPHNVIRSIIPIFEATATNILGQMSQGHMSVEFVTEKTLKSNSKKEVTTLDIIINDSDTGRLPYMSRSGGERVKAALSVILALAEIKSSKAGVQLGFLFIDEPPFLDQPGVQAYCDALEAIQMRYTDLKVMAITHDPAMKSRFPQSVDVVKTPDGSKVIYE